MMARTKLVDGIRVPFTAEEEAERDAEELAWANRPAEKRRMDVDDLWAVMKTRTGATDADLPADVEAPKARGA